jgi:transposase
MSSRRKRGPGRPSKYPFEFQRDAVAMVLVEGRPIAEVARALNVNEGTLGNWVQRERKRSSEGTALSVDERAELAELRRELAEVRMERDLLKRTVAFWVKESTL